MKEIHLSKFGKNRGKFVALVDDEYYEELNKLTWHVHISFNGLNLYAQTNIKICGGFKIIKMHQLIMKGKGIDHRDGNGLNNQKSNLRFCTNQENMRNRNPNRNSSSKYKGVGFDKESNNWVAFITVNKIMIKIGRFSIEDEAAKAYDKKAVELFGEYAKLNFKPCY